MCLIFISLQHHPTYKLVIAANRDEFYQRKTAAADYWNDDPTIIGGRDLEASGTWMAMNTNGRIGMVTNYRDLKNLKQQAPSRGALVSEFLIGSEKPKEYLQKVEPTASQYNGFNLLVGDADELWYLSNYKTGIERVAPGIHGLSNALLDTPWPKVENGKEAFAQAIEGEVVPENLFALLKSEQRARDEQLPDTGVGLERERMLSSMFIKSPNYGTRCSTVVMIDWKNNVTFAERVYNLETFEFTTQQFQFTV
jgi:uncharacterized protein with NRDE domain